MKGKVGSYLLLSALFAGSAAIADDEFRTALSETKYSVNWRIRHETVEQAGFALDARALTSRVRAGFETGALGGTRLLAEMVGTSELSRDFNSTLNGQTQYPVVADPGGFAAINRFALINKSLAKTTLTLGRQRLILDDARFVGNVGWRQNEQTFDGLASHTAGEKFTVDLAYITQVNRIFGPESPNGKWDGDVVLLNGSRSFGFGKITLFGYSLEFDQAAAASSETLGFTLSGKKAFGDTALIYTLSAASQSEAGNNAADYSEMYTKIEGGVTQGRLTVALGQEVLGSDGVNAFMTPLATLHAFQGWGDKFLSTPAGGIVDGYLRIAYSFGVSGTFDSLGLTAFYHQFDADFGSADYGDEFDVQLAAKTGRTTLTLKYATYSADSFATDTDKLWLSMDYAF